MTVTTRDLLPTRSRGSLVEIFDASVAAHGARLALEAPDATLTYSELAASADELAARLRARGVGPGDRVGVWVPSGTAALYVAILAVLRSGAAYVPVDADETEERAAVVFGQAGVCAVVGAGLAVEEPATGSGAGRVLEPDDDAWVIFTSGSTGTPKGVAVSHRAASAFVAAEGRLWTVSPEDRVLAGLSVGFDASCEEIWLAWANGAALVPAPRDIVRAGADLGRWLAVRRVSVVSTVPTIASMWDERELAGVRLLVLGGEACPEALAWRLAADREVWNTYGPTEATVVSTASQLQPGAPVTIGWALDGWRVAVVDEAGEPVEFGAVGELVIAGVGLGRYLDRDLDRQRFAPLRSLGWERAYRSGDLVRETAQGLEYVGRRDGQVKLGGRRIELGEVDAALLQVPGVRAAAAAVRRTPAGNDLLVGYVTGDVEPERVRDAAAALLPHGLAPLVVVVEELPLRPSGKVDRAALPWPPPAPAAAAALEGTVAWLAEQWAVQLGPLPMDEHSDFFQLGGSSVSAARLVSVLRERYPAVAVADVYAHRTLAHLAARLDGMDTATERPAAADRPRARRRWAVASVMGWIGIQAFLLPPLLLVLLSLDSFVLHAGPRLPWWALVAGWLVVVSGPGRALMAVGVRRLLLPRLEPGRYPRHSGVAMRLWFVDRVTTSLRANAFAGTPWAARYARLYGARVGDGVMLMTIPPLASLVEIGDGAVVENQVDLHGWWVDGHEVVVGEVRIGAGARVGASAVLMPGTDIGVGAEVEVGSVVVGHVPAGERWAGNPARRVGSAADAWPHDAPPAEPRRRLWRSMYAVGMGLKSSVVVLASLPDVAIVAAVVGRHASFAHDLAETALWTPVLVVSYMLAFALMTAAVFRVVCRWLRPGWHSIDGSAAWASWLSDGLLAATVGVMFPVYASLLTRSWLRLLGIRIGHGSELSHSRTINPLVSFGAMSFAADAPGFETSRAMRGWFQLSPIRIGDRTFIGNSALVDGGSTIGDDALIGVKTVAPRHVPDGTAWFGSPALQLSRSTPDLDPARTTNPPRRLVLGRAATEAVRIVLPTSVTAWLGLLLLALIEEAGRRAGAVGLVLAALPAMLACSLLGMAATVLVKWVAIGRYRSSEHPYWSFFVWRDELVNSMQEVVATPWGLGAALGTPVMSGYLRAMGARIGRDVWFETSAVTEYDLVTADDGAVVNRAVFVQTHLVHDRLLRLGPTHLQAGSTLGPRAAVLPDTELGAGTTVGAMSVVLRGERLPSGTRWQGAPVSSA